MNKSRNYQMKKIIVSFFFCWIVGTIFSQCPAGSSPLTSSTAEIKSGETYCASSDVLLTALTIENGGKLIITNKAVVTTSSNFIVGGELIVEDGSGVESRGSFILGTHNTGKNSSIRLGKSAFISYLGSLLINNPKDATGNGTSKIYMDDNSVFESCTPLAFSSDYPLVEFTGTSTSKAYFITRTATTFYDNPFTLSPQIYWIAVDGSTHDKEKGDAKFCNDPNCGIWPDGLTKSTSTCFEARGIVDKINPLPIELVSFSGSCEEGLLTFKWTTATERNVDYFQVESSMDGVRWETVGIQQATGFSSVANDYEMSREARNKVEYFRLKSVDFDGSIQTFLPISIRCENEGVNHWVVAPNPAHGQTVLTIFSAEEGTTTISMYDMEGRLVNETHSILQKGSQQISVDISNLRKGLYIISLRDKTNNFKPLRLMVE